MKQTTIGGNKRKAANMLAMLGLILIFAAYMFPFLMVVINSLKQKRDIIKSPFSWYRNERLSARKLFVIRPAL